MKKLLVAITVVMLSFTAVVFAQTIPADKKSIDLKETWNVKGNRKSVVFKHEQHSSKLSCKSCHQSDKGGKIVLKGDIKGSNNKNPAHQFCWSCHAEQPKDPVKKVCTKCHTG